MGLILDPTLSRPEAWMQLALATYESPARHVALWLQGDDAWDPWPDWCFLPLQAVEGMRSSYGGLWPKGLLPGNGHAQKALLCGAFAWQTDPRTYTVDREISEKAQRRPPRQTLPVSTATELPTWCSYVETPAGVVPGLSPAVQGFFAVATYERGPSRRSSLWLFPDMLSDTTGESVLGWRRIFLGHPMAESAALMVDDRIRYGWAVPADPARAAARLTHETNGYVAILRTICRKARLAEPDRPKSPRAQAGYGDDWTWLGLHWSWDGTPVPPPRGRRLKVLKAVPGQRHLIARASAAPESAL